MADIDFPASLPGPLDGSFQENSVDPWVQDTGEVGASRRRKRFTRKLRSFSFKMRLTSDQKDELLSFYDDDLDDGVDMFSWVHPDGQTLEVRMASRPPVQHVTAEIWDVDLVLKEI